ncbi:unnamed protein product [Linum trigynum]|uniref:Integrase catalytic domain-containing protein n=1 Tax=Linum trigynum TaxID=586398 RepID=A0AAV2CX19_9ROSI
MRIGLANQHRGLYHLATTNSPSFAEPSPSHQAATIYNFNPHQVNLWHWHLGHPSRDRYLLVKNNNSIVTSDLVLHCDICHLSKQKRLSFPLSDHSASEPFALIHVDIWGPLSVKSYDGFSYFLTIVDDYTRAVWVYLMHSKAETRELLQGFCQLVNTQFAKQVKTIRSGQGKEFHMTEFYRIHGIEHQTSCVETPQQNGRVERKHQHILNVARALRFQSGIPLKFWSDCILHSVYLINRMPTPLLQNKSPFEMLFNRPPLLQNLRVFGCLSYATTLPQGRTKFQPRARQSIFLGFPSGVKGYKLFDLHDHHVFISRNVTFYEDILPFKTIPDSPPPLSTIPHSSPLLAPHSIPTPIPNTSDNLTSRGAHPVPAADDVQIAHDTNSCPDDQDNVDVHLSGFNDGENVEEQLELEVQAEYEGRPIRVNRGKLPAKLDDYYVGSVSRYPMSDYLGYDQLAPKDKHYALSLIAEVEPSSYQEAAKSEVWNKAMNEEREALELNQTWEVVPLPKGKRAIGCKWVYTIKMRPDGRIERRKARLVAKGFTQIHGIDFLDTYSPVAKINSVKALLAVAASKGWVLEQMDVSNAFLHGDLEEEVHMQLPPGDPRAGSKDNLVCKLKKSLYGLKQASRQWFAKLTSSLLQHGFSQSASDYSLFTKWVHGRIVVLLVYVDDIILGGADKKDIEEVKLFLSRQFKIKDLGSLKYFLGLEITRNSEGIAVCQRKYCLDLLEDTGYLDAKDCKSPLDPKVKLKAKQVKPLDDPEVYRRLIGRLHYLTTTRPDLTFPMQQLSQFQKEPYTDHLQAAFRVLRYIKGSPGQGIFFKAEPTLRLIGYSDSDWASCPDSRRSITGYCTFLGSSLITWKSKKQTTVSRSSSEAEYRALAHLGCEVQWLKNLLAKLSVEVVLPISVFCDNRSAIHIAENPVFHERTKHIEIDVHVIRERVKAGLIKLFYVKTED